MALISWWVALYTAGLSSEACDLRRQEIESDMSEQRLDDRRHGRAPLQTAFQMMIRLLCGIPADLTWRLEQGVTPSWGLAAGLFAMLYFALAVGGWSAMVTAGIPGRAGTGRPILAGAAVGLLIGGGVLVWCGLRLGLRSRRLGSIVFTLGGVLLGVLLWSGELSAVSAADEVVYAPGVPALFYGWSVAVEVWLVFSGAVLAATALRDSRISPRLSVALILVGAPVLSVSILAGGVVAAVGLVVATGCSIRPRSLVVPGALVVLACVSTPVLPSFVPPALVAIVGLPILGSALLTWVLMIVAIVTAYGYMIPKEARGYMRMAS